jgi:hypothetical protein
MSGIRILDIAIGSRGIVFTFFITGALSGKEITSSCFLYLKSIINVEFHDDPPIKKNGY